MAQTTAEQARRTTKFPGLWRAVAELRAAVARLPSRDSIAGAVARWLDEEA